MAKSFHVFFQKKSPFSAFGVIQDTKMGVQDRTRGPRHHGEHGELETWNQWNRWNQWNQWNRWNQWNHGISGINGITGISGIRQPGSGIGVDRKG